MSIIYKIHCKILKKDWENENIIDDAYISRMNYPQKENDKLDLLNHQNFSFPDNSSPELSNYIPKRSYSVNNLREMIDLSDCRYEKMKFNEWIVYNRENNKKLEDDVLKLLIEIFDKRYSLYPNNVCPLSSYSLQSQKYFNMICTKYNELAIYILNVLYNQINPFLDYIDKKLNFKSMDSDEFNNIKEILYFIGKDLKKIFNEAIELTENFKFPSVLLSMLEEYIIKGKKIGKKVFKKIKSPIYKTKENFEKFLKDINYLEFRKEYDFNLNIKNKKNIEIESIQKKDEPEYKEKNIINLSIFNNLKNSQENENKENDNKDENKSNKSDILNLNIEDLVKYINESGDKEIKKKKKRRNKRKKEEKNKKEKIYVEDDLVFLNYKKALEEYTQSALYTKKVRPKYSEQFLQRLQILSQ